MTQHLSPSTITRIAEHEKTVNALGLQKEVVFSGELTFHLRDCESCLWDLRWARDHISVMRYKETLRSLQSFRKSRKRSGEIAPTFLDGLYTGCLHVDDELLLYSIARVENRAPCMGLARYDRYVSHFVDCEKCASRLAHAIEQVSGLYESIDVDEVQERAREVEFDLSWSLFSEE